MRNTNVIQELISSVLAVAAHRFVIDPALDFGRKKIEDLTAPPSPEELEAEFAEDQDEE